ncbi:MAG: hypothetical protein HYY41_04215 [Chloroflexi bacterium]|nr:hypothetical protein [Chloroflexota bacterium]
MRKINPLILIAAGFALLLLGFLMLFLMVIRLVPPSFGLSFLAYLAGSTGLIIGLIGVVRRLR